MTHPLFRRKLEAIGFGVLVPVFFVTSGLRFDLDALLGDPSNLAMVPVFLLALAVVRGLPAALPQARRPGEGARRGALQATSLLFIVAGTAIGRSLGLIGGTESAELIAAGLLSVLLSSLIGSVLLRRDGEHAPAEVTDAGHAGDAPLMAM
jgi:Kef-type K+ transport system membrane component KefB